MYGRLFCFKRPSTKGRRKLFGNLTMSHGIPLPDQSAMLIVSMIVDLSLGEALQKFLV